MARSLLRTLAALLAAARWRCCVEGVVFRSSATPQPGAGDSFRPEFHAPQLTPTQFLFVSSPSEKKVVYTQLKNFKSLTGRTFALVDSGLEEPAGLAFDRARGWLYVADRGASRIFRYRVLVQDSGAGVYSLATDGVQLCIMQGQAVEWVSVDITGDVFYSDTARNTINRIPIDTIDRLGEGAYQCGDLQVKSQKAQMIQAERQAAELQSMTDAQREASRPTDPPDTEPVIFSVYEGSVNPHVTVPGGVVSDGARLYWTNLEAGKEAGTLVQGKVKPDLPLVASNGSEPAPFASTALTSESDAAYGIAKSSTMVFYTTNRTGTGYVYGMLAGGQPHAFVSSLIQPRGLCWDGDNTVYVADERGNSVFSFPVGRLMDDAPLSESAALTGAFGVALFSLHDDAFKGDMSAKSAAAGLRNGPPAALQAAAAIAASALAAASALRL